MLKLIQQVNSLMNKLIKRLNKGEEKMMRVIVAMMLVVGMLGCSKESGEGDTSKEKSTKEGYKFGFTEWAAGTFFDACYDGVMSVVEEKGERLSELKRSQTAIFSWGLLKILLRRMSIVYFIIQ